MAPIEYPGYSLTVGDEKAIRLKLELSAPTFHDKDYYNTIYYDFTNKKQNCSIMIHFYMRALKNAI